jgi:hypothetical protein
MKQPDTLQLMHLVLDGEASAEEARELDRAIAADPAARAQFEDLKKFFTEMRRVPELEPPAELEPAALQLFDQLRVSSKKPDHSHQERIAMSQRINDQDPTVTNQPALPAGNHKKRLIVGATIAAVAVVVAGSYFFDVPPSSSTSGTIAPATRYRADQPKADDIKLGGQDKQNPTTNQPVTPGGVGQAGGGAGQSGGGAGQSGGGAGQSGGGAGQSGSGIGQSGGGVGQSGGGAGQSGGGAGQSGGGAGQSFGQSGSGSNQH